VQFLESKASEVDFDDVRTVWVDTILWRRKTNKHSFVKFFGPKKMNKPFLFLFLLSFC